MSNYNNVSILQMTSAKAAEIFCDGSLDAVYIDANHNYENVKQDISMWLPKLKDGGMMTGHDYQWTDVKKACDELIGPVDKIFRDGSWFKKIEKKGTESDSIPAS